MWGRMGEGSGNRFGEVRPAESWWGMAGVSWHCGGGHMEGRLALWLPPERAPADRGRFCQEEGREQRERERDGVCLWYVAVKLIFFGGAAGSSL